jgi:hypothetical protein
MHAMPLLRVCAWACWDLKLALPGHDALALFETGGPVGDLSQSDNVEVTMHCTVIVFVISAVVCLSALGTAW